MQKKGIYIIKILLFIVITTSSYFLNKTLAIAINDCDITLENIKNFQKESLNEKTIDYEKAFPKDALERAIKNLNTYCCKKVLNQSKDQNKKKCDSTMYTNKYPESPYLFDHLIDVGIRRLDVINNYEDVSADPTGEKRRKYIQSVATNPNIIIPKEIKEKYEYFRTLQPNRMFKKNKLKIENMDQTEISKISTYLEKYDNEQEITLANKYNNLCRLTWNIYEKKPGKKIIIEGKNIENCQKMISKRIQEENLYVKTILIQKANKMLEDNLQAILQKQFVQNKLEQLKSDIIGIKNLLQILVRQAPYCKKCSK